MILRSLKWGLVAVSGAILLGGILLGRDMASYVSCGVQNARDVVKENVPVEVELERARHMIEDILPELRANVRVIAQEEVEVAHLQREIDEATETVASQRGQVSLLRERLDTQQVSFTVGRREMSRDQVVERLASRLDRFKQAKATLASKQRLLETREKSLAAAVEMLERTRSRKAELEQKIEALVAQHRVVRAQSVASSVHIDDSRLARADNLVTEIEKRLQTAQRVLAHEAELVVDDIVEEVSEDELLAEVDVELGGDFDVFVALQTADE